MVIVGLSGFAGSGKDAVGDVLVHDYGFTRRAFADKLKRIAWDLGWSGNKDEVGRRFLQDLGVACRGLDPDYWVRPVLLDLPSKLVITDVRFQNDAIAITRAGGLVIWIERPGVEAVNQHVSEHDLAEWNFDGAIINDGTLADLANKVGTVFG